MDCALIADDLTGACDAAIQFRMRGVRSVIQLDSETIGDADVQAFSTETRDLEQSAVASRIRELAARLSGAAPRWVFKKIDSLLRGNPGLEIAATLDAFGFDVAIVTPAYPELGRTVWDGNLLVDGDTTWKPVAIAAQLGSEHTKPECLGEALRGGARCVSVDATTDSDLALIVEEGLRSGRRVLWAGSGGLASALAETLFGAAIPQISGKKQALPVLFCIGSEHPVTVEQLARLQQERAKQIVLKIPGEPGAYESLRLSLRDIRGLAGALLLSGGDSASTVCRALEVEQIELEGQIVAGVPWGVLKGGLLDGMLAATKSGAFGCSDALVKVADFFS